MSKVSYFSFSSSTAKKYLMAVTGALLFGFIVAHLLGNLQIFEGQEKINAYAAFLKSLGPTLWAARLWLLAAVLIHIYVSIKLTLENQAARPTAYAHKEYVEASYASRTMAISGFIILAYIIFHLAHFTFGVTHPQFFHLTDAKGRHDVYSMMVLSFQVPWISIAYLFCIFLLCFHLSHGLSSAFQSLGANNMYLRPRLKRLGQCIAWLIFLGYASIPASVLLGFVHLPPGVHP